MTEFTVEFSETFGAFVVRSHDTGLLLQTRTGDTRTFRTRSGARKAIWRERTGNFAA